jgi:hypothetical protein
MLAGRRRGLIVYRLVTVCLAQEGHIVDSLVFLIPSITRWASQLVREDLMRGNRRLHFSVPVSFIAALSVGCVSTPDYSAMTEMQRAQTWEACQQTPKEFRANCEKQYIRSECARLAASEASDQQIAEMRKKQGIAAGAMAVGSLIPYAGMGIQAAHGAIVGTSVVGAGATLSSLDQGDTYATGGPYDRKYRECLRKNGVEYSKPPKVEM